MPVSPDTRARPKGLLFDFGGTLVEEVAYDVRAGTEALLARAVYLPPHVHPEHVLDRVNRVSADVVARREECQVETPWPAFTRLIHDFFGTRFTDSMAELEMIFWKASVTTRPMPGARDVLAALHQRSVPMAVVSNSSFSDDVIRYELAKHGLAEHLAFVMVSAEYAIRKPNALLFETAGARLSVAPRDIWFVGDRLDTDIAGARAAGMTAVWFRPRAAGSSDAADLAVKSWGELIDCFHASLG